MSQYPAGPRGWPAIHVAPGSEQDPKLIGELEEEVKRRAAATGHIAAALTIAPSDVTERQIDDWHRCDKWRDPGRDESGNPFERYTHENCAHAILYGGFLLPTHAVCSLVAEASVERWAERHRRWEDGALWKADPPIDWDEGEAIGLILERGTTIGTLTLVVRVRQIGGPVPVARWSPDESEPWEYHSIYTSEYEWADADIVSNPDPMPERLFPERAALLRWHRQYVLGKPVRPGRTDEYESESEFMAALLRAVPPAWKDAEGSKPTRAHIANRMGISVPTLRKYVELYGIALDAVIQETRFAI
jgi:hypothetical protein